jgi:DNA-directed RNA polymerase specialized sigma subunit
MISDPLVVIRKLLYKVAAKAAFKNGEDLMGAAKKIRPNESAKILNDFAPMMKVSIDQIKDHAKVPLDPEDLLAAAVTGLLEAIKGYDPYVDRNFRKFAETSIRRAMLDEIRKTADFYQHINVQPVGPAEATHHRPKMTFGFDRKGHKYH